MKKKIIILVLILSILLLGSIDWNRYRYYPTHAGRQHAGVGHFDVDISLSDMAYGSVLATAKVYNYTLLG